MGTLDTAGLGAGPLSLRLLGPMELCVGGRTLALPRSKKTRALLAYLAVTGRPQRRERLCALLWDVTDDPRGALRWSLSRLRSVLREEAGRIVADHHEVALHATGIAIDARALAVLQQQGVAAADTGALEVAAALCRGEFLEGLELPDFLDFSAWCIEQREQARRCHGAVLAELVRRLQHAPERALAHARQRARVEAFDLDAHEQLLRLLLQVGHVTEAQQRFDQAQRLLRQASAVDAIALDRSWRALRATAMAGPPSAPAPPPAATDADALLTGGRAPFVGRQRTLAQLQSLLDDARRCRATRVALVTGEPGVGKSRLAEQLCGIAEASGFAVVVGRAFEAEASRSFGPWTDALGVDVQHEATVGQAAHREDLFGRLRARLAERAAPGQGLLLVLDDLQWFDRNSAELLHFVLRSDAGCARVVIMLARAGELPDNEAAMRLLRSLRREGALPQVELGPLSREDIAALVAGLPGIDGGHVHDVSAGNPLYALEFVRAHREGRAGPPATVVQLLRDRVAKVPERAAEVLRWVAVCGRAVDLGRLEGLTAMAAEDLVDALERLEQSALLCIDATRVAERYACSHDLVREAVYGELSLPRRRVMHRKLARLLEPHATEPSVAAELAQHASLAGEAALGVRACMAAGQHALRVFANGDAEALARRGLRLAEELDEPQRVATTLELLQVLFTARTPEREEAAARVHALAERALDLGLTDAARRGFQIVSFLRWEHSSLADAHAHILQSERVSRLAAPDERATALAHAARCLVLLERNLQQAEAFALEADAVQRRDGRSSAAVSFALGMIAAHRGEAGVAAEAFAEARQFARQQGEHLAEFGALEHHMMLEIDRGRHAQAVELAVELAALGLRVRPGAELHAGRALLALARVLAGADADEAGLPQAVEAVREADAKYELSYLLTRWAAHALDAGPAEEGRRLAAQALEVAREAGRQSESAHALATLAMASRRQRRAAEARRQLALLEPLAAADLSASSRDRVAAVRRADLARG